MIRLTCLLLLPLLLGACATSPPKNTGNICSIFAEKDKWYKKAKRSQDKWGSPIPTLMAIMHQESRFRAKAKPPRRKILWVIPGPRQSDAYGYPQAKDSTWDWYRKSSGNRWADRDNFGDAVDFVGWYNAQTHKKNRVRLNDTYNLYLAYHEGHGGFKRRSYKNKKWLKQVAGKVTRQANRYQQQLSGCEQRFKRGFRLWPFF